MKVLLATGNKDKVKEIREILGDRYEVISMKEAGFNPDIIEDGETYEDNAMIKCEALHELMPEAVVIADDSGIEIEALGNQPGVHSARYMGEDTPYEIKNAKFIELLEGKKGEKERAARFVCAMAAILPDGTKHTVRGIVEGWIGYEPMGDGGFGYDPIFYLPGTNYSTASISAEEKHAISHRGKAMRAMAEYLDQVYSN